MRYAVSLAALLMASPVTAGEPSYPELIFCSRWAAGLYATLSAAGEADTEPAKTALAAWRWFGYRALKATPSDQYVKAGKIVDVANDTVTRILASGGTGLLINVSVACSNL